MTPTRVNLTGYCQQTDIRTIRTQVSVPGVMLGIITLGIYSQTSIIIICTSMDRKKKKAADGQEPHGETVNEANEEASQDTPNEESEASESSESSEG